MSTVPQGGAIVFRTDGGSLQILLVRAKKDPSQWIFPKGHLDPGESHAAAALREAAEEAGVSGVIVGLVGPGSTFQSGDEQVSVEYYLLQMGSETASPEGREKKWVAPEAALNDLAFADARQLLRTALPELERRLHGSETDRFHEFMLHEYDHLAESLLANEEGGEKRVAFFITLCGAVGAGLGFVLSNKAFALPQRLIVDLALAVLLVLGYATLVRVVARNAASDRYKNRLSRVRQYFVTGRNDPRVGFLPFHPYDKSRREPRTTRWSLGRGGWLETVVLVEALLAFAFVAFNLWMFGKPDSGWNAVIAIVGGALSALLVWSVLLGRSETLYEAELG